MNLSLFEGIAPEKNRRRWTFYRPDDNGKPIRQLEFKLKQGRLIAFKKRSRDRGVANEQTWDSTAAARLRFQLLLDLEERFLDASFKDQLEVLLWMIGPEDEPFSFFYCISQHGLPRFIADAGFRQPDEVIDSLRERMHWLMPVFALPGDEQVAFLKSLIARHAAGEKFN